MPERRFTFAVHRLAAELDRQADLILRARLDLTYGDFLYLVHIAGGVTSMSELARRMGLTRAAVSKRVPELEARGLVRRDGAGRDRALRLTAAGGRLASRAGDLLEREFRDAFPDSGTSLDRTAARLERMTAQLQQHPWQDADEEPR